MRPFLHKLFLFSCPLFVLAIVYFITDPFQVIWKNPTRAYGKYEQFTGPSRDYIGNFILRNNYRQQRYNSFIFGNSRSIFYEVDTWKKYLPKDASCFHYDASGESLYGIERKIHYLDVVGLPLHHVILTLDQSTLAQTFPRQGFLFAIAPPTELYSNFISFHATYLGAFFKPRFLAAWGDYLVRGQIRKYMKKWKLIQTRTFAFDEISNEIRYENAEQEIQMHSFYTPAKIKEFKQPASSDSIDAPVIRSAQVKLLRAIQQVFLRHRTHAKIIVHPLYNKIRLHPDDVRELRSIFGADAVFDFSGRNAWTSNYMNYYEPSHYRPHIADSVLARIYQPTAQ